MGTINRGLSIAEFTRHVNQLRWLDWKPSLIVIHHTWAPSLAQRPAGFTDQHIDNIAHYYQVDKGWKTGPHMFIDDDQCWLYTPLTQRGTHSKSFNATGIGIEMLGNYDLEDPWSGRGLKVLETTFAAMTVLMKALNLSPEAIRFHRDDPKTDKTCPGTRIDKGEFLKRLKIYQNSL
jgi:hypothetical protein